MFIVIFRRFVSKFTDTDWTSFDAESFDGANMTDVDTKEDHHRYYNRYSILVNAFVFNEIKIKYKPHQWHFSTTYLNPKDGQRFWVDLDSLDNDKVVTHEGLSQFYRRAEVIS